VGLTGETVNDAVNSTTTIASNSIFMAEYAAPPESLPVYRKYLIQRGQHGDISWALAHLEFSVNGNPAETDLVP
jgi:hypothetical protein